MDDKLKRAFTAPPWTQKEIANWERIRGKGIIRFAARIALLWGTIMYIGMSILYYLEGQPVSARSLLVRALIFYPPGFLVGLFIWVAKENAYHQNRNAK
jgi:hypothetical protein